MCSFFRVTKLIMDFCHFNCQFRGEVKKINNHFYILKNRYALPPLTKMPKLNPLPVISIPAPQSNIPPITLSIESVDGF